MSPIRVLAVLGLLAAACGAQTVRPPANRTATHPSTATKAATTTAQPRIPDAQLEADIRARLARSKKISLDHLQVHVQGGVATLEGRTSVVQHKGAATRMAKAAGALAVNNRIQISEDARAKAASNLENGRRRAQIKRGDARSDTRTTAPQPH